MKRNLNEYNNKRNFTRTDEPKGIVSKPNKKLKFVVQHHIAKKDHYDLRLECDGVFLSWAVPKGPSYNSEVKRLSINVEDHPLSYGNFEGTIEKGEYGAGTVMLWDKGYYEPINDIKTSYKKGNIKFILKGKRLKGKWTLIRIKDNNWLLIKEKDEYSSNIDINKYKKSIKTNRTMQEIKNNKTYYKTSKKDSIVCGIKITNPNKVIFKNPKITKLDIALYYHKIAPKMLPYLQNRLLSTVRLPGGVNTPKFFKKHFNENPYLGKKRIKNKNGTYETYYFIKDERGLIYEVQLNSFEFHTSATNVKDLNHPNQMIFDLDPDETLNIKAVKQGVKDLKKILDKLNLKSYLKTSGGKGYHIVVPIKEKISWNKFTKIAQSIAEVMEEKYNDKYTSNIRKKYRKNKIFIDWIRNTKNASSVCAYSLRLKDSPSISYPIPFSKLDKTNPDSYKINSL